MLIAKVISLYETLNKKKFILYFLLI